MVSRQLGVRLEFVLAALLCACTGDDASEPKGASDEPDAASSRGARENDEADAGSRNGRSEAGSRDAGVSDANTDAVGAGAGGTDSRGEGQAGLPGPPGVESCDGYDNDANGVIDDLDVEGDGVCDCLNIATIGTLGTWGDGGNVFSDWLSTRSPRGFVALGDEKLTDDLLRPFQVIVVLNASTVDGHHSFSKSEIAALERWVRAGGGVMTTTGYTWNEAVEQENVNLLLAPFGMSYSTTKLELDGYAQNWLVHPLTEEISNIYVENGVEPAGPDDTTLAYIGDDQVALQATEADRGRVVVWGDEWITYDSQWEDVADQQVARFWVNILGWLSPPRVCQVEP